MPNNYIFKDNYGVGYTRKGDQFLFSIKDYEKIKPITWWKDVKSGYIVGWVNKKNVYLHTYIIQKPNSQINNMVVDHINRNKSDNRRSNLRVVTSIQNSYNRKLNKNNKSGHKGVYWIEKRKKWEANIRYDKKLHFLGYYANINDAVKARIQAEKEHFGEYRADLEVL